MFLYVLKLYTAENQVLAVAALVRCTTVTEPSIRLTPWTINSATGHVPEPVPSTTHLYKPQQESQVLGKIIITPVFIAIIPSSDLDTRHDTPALKLRPLCCTEMWERSPKIVVVQHQPIATSNVQFISTYLSGNTV
jgi:hypothetical protein